MSKNLDLFESAKQYYVGGVHAANRYHSCLGAPVYVDRMEGCRLYDVDGKEYLDFHTSAGAALFGYKHPRLMEAAMKAIDRGAVMNFETEEHVILAELMQKFIPCAERIRIGNTGTEVTQAALRVARGYTGRDICIRMEGHFHGMHELIWYNHDGKAEMAPDGEIAALPDTAGVPECFRSVIKNVPFNDYETLERICDKYSGQVACIIMEPISYNCGCYPAVKSYLEKVRALCDREDIVLIFDEVISGMRLRPGSAQAYYGVTPDLATFGKAIGGTFPIAALCGKKKVMDVLKPVGGVGMSGTYTGSLMAVLASIECFKMAMEPDFYDRIDATAEQLYGGINQLFAKYGVKGHCRGMGARFGMFFGVEDPELDMDWRAFTAQYDAAKNRAFVTKGLEKGLYFVSPGKGPAPSHCGFGIMHTKADIDLGLEKMEEIFRELR